MRTNFAFLLLFLAVGVIEGIACNCNRSAYSESEAAIKAAATISDVIVVSESKHEKKNVKLPYLLIDKEK